MKTISISCLLLFCLAGYSQNFEPDASIWKDPWISCRKTINPKSEYGVTHWIQYDLGHVRRLSKSWVWNVNDPDKLDQGFREVRIDYSINGYSWEYLGEMAFPKASGEAVYGGFEGPDLLDVEARYVLLTVVNTYGNGDCAGLSEIKFNLRPPLLYQGEEELEELPENHNNLLALYPNPVHDELSIRTVYNGLTRFLVYTIDGRFIYERSVITTPNSSVLLDAKQLVPGMYVLRAENSGYQSVAKFVVR